MATTSRRRVGKSAAQPAKPRQGVERADESASAPGSANAPGSVNQPGPASAPQSANGPGAAFLLAQLGAHAAARFAERIATLNLTPAQTGLMRAVSATPGRSQQALAQRLGTPPSRLVALVDDLDDLGLLERRRNPDDRRLHALYVTDAGQVLLRKIGQVARAHDDAIGASLDQAERTQLRALLSRIANEQGLTPGVHPGYRSV